jgi:hypothetical protein
MLAEQKARDVDHVVRNREGGNWDTYLTEKTAQQSG